MNVDIKGTICSNDDDWIYSFYEIEHTTPQAITKALEEANGERVDVYINSGGGDVISANEIYSSLQSYNGDVKIHIVGIAASAATIIMCAGFCDITAPSVVMIHNASMVTAGNFADLQKDSETLRTIDKAICQAYITKTGKTEKEFLKLMDNTSWLTSEQAVELGLCDEVVGKEVIANGFCVLVTDEQRAKAEAYRRKAAEDRLTFEKIKNRKVQKNVNDRVQRKKRKAFE